MLEIIPLSAIHAIAPIQLNTCSIQCETTHWGIIEETLRVKVPYVLCYNVLHLIILWFALNHTLSIHTTPCTHSFHNHNDLDCVGIGERFVGYEYFDFFLNCSNIHKETWINFTYFTLTKCKTQGYHTSIQCLAFSHIWFHAFYTSKIPIRSLHTFFSQRQWHALFSATFTSKILQHRGSICILCKDNFTFGSTGHNWHSRMIIKYITNKSPVPSLFLTHWNTKHGSFLCWVAAPLSCFLAKCHYESWTYLALRSRKQQLYGNATSLLLVIEVVTLESINTLSKISWVMHTHNGGHWLRNFTIQALLNERTW